MKSTKLLPLSILTISITACVTTPNQSKPPTNNDTLTDAQLIATVQQFNRHETTPATGVIGVHNGNTVIEEIHCSDLCPENTMRVLHYDIDDEAQCAQAGGVTKSILTPIAITVMPKEYCFPAVIADYWESYQAN